MNANRQSMILPGDGPNVYHLVKPEQDDSGDGEGQRGQKIVSEVFLTRLLSTKVCVCVCGVCMCGVCVCV